MLDRPLSARIFFEQVIRDNLDLGRPDRVCLIFDRGIYRGQKSHTAGTFTTRMVTDGVTPSPHVQYKHSQIKRYHKEGRAAASRGSTTRPTDACCASNDSATTPSPALSKRQNVVR